jgi:hypothetical protein
MQRYEIIRSGEAIQSMNNEPCQSVPAGTLLSIIQDFDAVAPLLTRYSHELSFFYLFLHYNK